MYKILCYLVALTLFGTYATFGQKPPVTAARPDNPTENYPTSDVFTNRKTVFIAHLLADKVEPEKKNAYNAWVINRTASLLYPNPCQTQRL
ncbi:hypothetical protein [Spirosoma spitsbergense]|uniref:hypothetical protein n=1 Tax=Spirosoma spitsbergense TaxID=431554 RepID=UPI00036C6352|nr:hypothetical protein [Spirosoma spitsbergense]